MLVRPAAEVADKLTAPDEDSALLDASAVRDDAAEPLSGDEEEEKDTCTGRRAWPDAGNDDVEEAPEESSDDELEEATKEVLADETAVLDNEADEEVAGVEEEEDGHDEEVCHGCVDAWEEEKEEAEDGDEDGCDDCAADGEKAGEAGWEEEEGDDEDEEEEEEEEEEDDDGEANNDHVGDDEESEARDDVAADDRELFRHFRFLVGPAADCIRPCALSTSCIAEEPPLPPLSQL